MYLIIALLFTCAIAEFVVPPPPTFRNLVDPIDIDVPPSDFDVELQRYLTAYENTKLNSDHFNALDVSTGGDPQDIAIFRYQSRNRTAFDATKFGKIIAKNPKSLVYFSDTNTIIMPNDEILNLSEADLEDELPDVYNYVEYSIEDLQKNSVVELEHVMIPATGCLTFHKNDIEGKGSVSIGYNTGISLKQKVGATANQQSAASAITYTLEATAMLSLSFSGSHKCFTYKGKPLRLFYRVFTISTEPVYRGIVFDTLSKRILGTEWTIMETKKFLFGGIAPLYFCATEDKMDLRCNAPGYSYTDANGNEIEYLLDAGEEISEATIYY